MRMMLSILTVALSSLTDRRHLELGNLICFGEKQHSDSLPLCFYSNAMSVTRAGFLINVFAPICIQSAVTDASTLCYV